MVGGTFDWVKHLMNGMLADSVHNAVISEKNLFFADLHLAVCPSWDLNNHVQDGLLLIGIKGDIVEWRNWNAILFDVDTVLQSVWSSDLSDSVFGSHCCI